MSGHSLDKGFEIIEDDNLINSGKDTIPLGCLKMYSNKRLTSAPIRKERRVVYHKVNI